MQLLRHGRGRGRRREHAHPALDLQLGVTGFRGGRHVGKRRRALRRGDGDGAHPAARERAGDAAGVGNGHQHLAAHHGSHRLVRALVAHEFAGRAGLRLEELEGEVVHARGAGVVGLLRVGLHVRGELLHRPDRPVRAHHDEKRERDGGGDRGEILRRVAHLLEHHRVGGEHGARGEKQRMAIGLGARDVLGGDHAGRAEPVLHHDRLAERLGELRRKDARHRIVRAAGGIADHQAHRLARVIRLGVGGKPACRRRAHGGPGQNREKFAHECSSSLEPDIMRWLTANPRTAISSAAEEKRYAGQSSLA